MRLSLCFLVILFSLHLHLTPVSASLEPISFIPLANLTGHPDPLTLDRAYRESELEDLAEIVRLRIERIQHPSNCTSAQKLLCKVDYNCGYCCQIHELYKCLQLTYATGRTMIIEQDGIFGMPWDEFLLPLTNCSKSAIEGQDRGPWEQRHAVVNDSIQVSGGCASVRSATVTEGLVAGAGVLHHWVRGA